MRVDELKSKILQLAIQGKLVEQNLEDESTSVLLEEIKKEKEILIKEKKIKKEKLLSEIKEEEKVFKLPNGWEWIKLGDISEKIHYGYTASAESEDTGVKLLRITDIQNNRVNWDTVPFCTIEENKLSSSVLNNNDILIARTGGTIGKSFIVKNVECTAVFASYLIRVKPLAILNSDYLKLFLESPLYWIQLQEKAKGTGQPNVNAVSLSNLVLPLPPIQEQKRIVAKVDELFELVDELNENKEAMIKNISHSRDKVLQLAIQGKLIEQFADDEPVEILLQRIAEEKEQLIKGKKIKKEKPLPEITDEEKAFDLPNGWEWCRLGQIGFTNIGLTYSPKDVSDSGIPVLRSTNIQKGKIDLNDLVYVKSDVSENKMCKNGDILICARNGSRRLVGKCAIIDEEGMSFGAFMAIYRSNYNKYVNLLLNSELFRKQLDDVNTVTINQITQEMLRNTICPLPPLEEQKRIVAKVDEIMNYLDELEKTIVEKDIM